MKATVIFGGKEVEVEIIEPGKKIRVDGVLFIPAPKEKNKLTVFDNNMIRILKAGR